MTATCHLAIGHQVVVGKLHQMGFRIGIALTGSLQIGQIGCRIAQCEESLAGCYLLGNLVPI